MNTLVDDEAFDLVKHRRVGGVAVAAIYPPRRDDAQGRALFQHRPDLHRRGMRPQQHFLASCAAVREIECVVHRARRVALGHVERSEIVPAVLDLWPGGDGKAEVGENLGQFVHYLAHRMDRAARRLGCGQAEIDCLGGKASFEGGAFQRGLSGGEGLGDTLAERVDLRPRGLALLRAHAAQRLQQPRNRTLFAKHFDTQRLENVERIRRADPRQRLITHRCVVHLNAIRHCRSSAAP